MKNLWEILFNAKRKKDEKKDAKYNWEAHKDRCYMEYRFIPRIVESVRIGMLSQDELLNIKYWKKYISHEIKTNFLFEWDEFNIEIVHPIDKCKIIIYKFPEPQLIPEAKYGAVIIDYLRDCIKYYTLERSMGDDWIIGSQYREQHYSYGSIQNNNLKDFIEWLGNHAQSKREIDKRLKQEIKSN